MSALVEHVEESILSRRLFRRGQSILVAVSGGMDSMVLLHVLNTLAPSHGWKLSVAHFNHQLRGRNSDGDERLVREAAKELDLPMLVGRGDVRKVATREKISIEMAARKMRHEFLARAAKSRRIRSVALAHHANDQIELFLLRLLRGSGSDGLAGMKWLAASPASPKILLARPLLDLPRRELSGYAKTNRIAYREDASNASKDILRNRIRLELIPLLTRHYQPALQKVLLREMEILGAESDFLNAAAMRKFSRKGDGIFESIPVALQRRILQARLLELGIAPNFDLVETLRNSPGRTVMIEGGTGVALEAGNVVRSYRKKVGKFRNGSVKLELKGSSGSVNFDGAHFEWEWEKMPGGTFRAPHKMVNHEVFDAHKAGDSILLRHWRAGDRFQPLGMPRAVKLQDLFMNAKIPRNKRHELVVATTKAGEIMWVEGLRPGERFKLDKSSTRRLNWRWDRPETLDT